MLSALSVVMLLLGSFMELVDLTAAALASFLVVFVFIEIGIGWAILTYGVTALCSFLLFPGGAPLFYAAFGLYPILKAFLERLPAALEWTLKLLCGNAILAAGILVAKFVLFLPDAALKGWLLWAFIALANLAFVLYDIALSRLIVYYSFRIRPRFARFLR